MFNENIKAICVAMQLISISFKVISARKHFPNFNKEINFYRIHLNLSNLFQRNEHSACKSFIPLLTSPTSAFYIFILSWMKVVNFITFPRCNIEKSIKYGQCVPSPFATYIVILLGPFIPAFAF